jgi:hypothetical protein
MGLRSDLVGEFPHIGTSLSSGAVTQIEVCRSTCTRQPEDDSSAYWEEITEELAPAGAILVFGHGKGKANASHHWVTYVEKHRQDVAAKLVADVRVDIDHIDEEQVLRLAQIYFDEAPQRDFGDNRRGASGS